MIKLHDNGDLRTFPDAQAIIAHFGLTIAIDHHETIAGIKAASDAGFPLHACVDPCRDEIRGQRVLMLDNDATALRAEYRLRCQDI
jgi:hypothetical protein